ncbi:amidase [Ancylobacter sp. 6x-1]|uniref:Amidase n=1 Tax=Ancylobacter crimeensis TaxID=2579147 RepID=A0ABT0DA30_9HYPH|nr:amidase [Ancylobacter crimeensis]MCK0196808.1 amidase [Ancylobacter crimeensis]
MTTLLSAAALAAAIREGRLTPLALAERCAERIAALEPEIGAFAALDLDRMRREAANEGPRLAGALLAGLPVGIKDIIDTADFPTRRGSPIYADHQPASDATAVRMVRRAGGLVAGKTETTEFAFMHPARTRNPHSAHHTPGGSSAGSAAAVAAGMLPLALGTQTGGSVIRPASFCGVTGFKPSFKLIPVNGIKVFSWSLDTIGLFAAGVRDAAFAMGALTGRDFALPDSSGTPRIAVVDAIATEEASPAAHEALAHAARLLARAGADVRPLALPEAVHAGNAAHGTMQEYEATLALADEWDRHRTLLSETLYTFLDAARAVTPEQYDEARRVARRARHALADAFADVDAIVTFSAPGEAPEGLHSTGIASFNRLWTLMGAPCVNVPGLTGATGLPLGIQIVGRFGRDRVALTVAAMLEDALAAG